jgi:hypothetical protein
MAATRSVAPRSREEVMRSKTSTQQYGGLTVLGIALVIVGAGWFGLRALQVDPLKAIADVGWPYFVIIPGVVLLIVSLFPTPPRGVGFAIAGSIVTVVGSVLLYQQTTGHWTSWAYTWALVGPGAAGLGMLVYGLIFGQRDLLAAGARLVAIAAVIFTVAYWYFETVFTTGQAPVDLGEWWPLVFVGIGLAALVAGMLSRGSRTDDPTTQPQAQGETR